MRESPAKCVRVGRSAGTSSMPAGHCMVTKRIQSPTRCVQPEMGGVREDSAVMEETWKANMPFQLKRQVSNALPKLEEDRRAMKAVATW